MDQAGDLQASGPADLTVQCVYTYSGGSSNRVEICKHCSELGVTPLTYIGWYMLGLGQLSAQLRMTVIRSINI